ncbi:uncharacterized protein LOC108669765 isoform X1 [Hyalella azteca]|uniref:Uncharacterized protein LOC108669765 isoform X1 n=2 Tax=Hyalella azteca TaxID=294128 RepID=A0A8B7NGA7_HYAAZ|nr:uncharacterized protein LOC108669765 isoform X1 [Hyalella azteca]
MVVKKRKVDFDLQPRPSAEASPPALVLGNYPSIVSFTEVASLLSSTTQKSILKNCIRDNQAYDSLCNTLIDLPPPPSNDLLSLDVLQQETVFKPRKAFANLVAVDITDLIEERKHSSDEEVENQYDTESTKNPLKVSLSDVESSIVETQLATGETPEVFTKPSDNDEPIVNKVLDDIYENLIDKEEEILWHKCEEYVSRNVRKLDDDHNELLNDFEIAIKRNKVADDDYEDCSARLGGSESLEVKIDIVDDSIVQSYSNAGLDETDVNDINKREVIEEPCIQTKLVVSESVETSEPVNRTRTDEVGSSDQNSQTSTKVVPSVERDMPRNTSNFESTLSVTNEEMTEFEVLSSSLTAPENDKQTNQQLLTPLSIVSCQSINATLTNTTQELTSRHRRKSGRKSHRKHSHSTKQAQSSSQLSDTTSFLTPSHVAKDPEQRALDAQAKFKKYLAKMSAAANTENLNCAGEPETLEPHMRDSIKESQILIWIYNMIDEAARVDFEFFLKDGCILCKLMNRIVPNCIPEEEITWEGARSKQKNINNFLKAAEKYGVPKAKLFFPEDLLHLRHLPRVTRCIYALAKIAQSDPSLGEDTPQLGDEPSFLKEGPTKVVIPGHRDTKEVLAQLTSSKEQEQKVKNKHSLYK